MRAALHRTALIAAACWLFALPAAAQDYGVDTVPFPAKSTSEPIVQAWINRYLPTRGYAIGAWSANVVMLVSVDSLKTDAWPQVSTEVLTETLTTKAANAAGWRAALQTMAFDCARDQYRTLSSLYFARGDRKGRFDQELGRGRLAYPGGRRDHGHGGARGMLLWEEQARRRLRRAPGARPRHARAHPASQARSRQGEPGVRQACRQDRAG